MFGVLLFTSFCPMHTAKTKTAPHGMDNKISTGTLVQSPLNQAPKNFFYFLYFFYHHSAILQDIATVFTKPLAKETL